MKATRETFPPISQIILTRIFSQVKVSTHLFYKGEPCWEWTAKARRGGYGCFYVDGFMYPVHRLAYALFVSAPSRENVVDHLCRVTHCVNPVHLEEVTSQVNILRGTSPSAVNAQKTHCKHGHALSGDNLIVHSQKGSRECRECRKRLTKYHNDKTNALPADHPKRVKMREQCKASALRLRDKHNAARRERYRLKIGQFAKPT